jgi:GNAT superfamily N-acetyltransferase
VLYAADRVTGRIVGLTRVHWNATHPAILEQGFTGVLKAYRGRGIGRWLKAAMLAKVLRERPAVALIRTSAGDSNAPMLKINAELGFRPAFAVLNWQVDTEAVEQYLRTKGSMA